MLHFSRLTEESARRTRGARVTRREKFKRTSRSFPPSPPCVCFHSPGKTQLNHGFFVVVIVVERSFTLNERNHRRKKKKKKERKERNCFAINVLIRPRNLESCKADGHSQDKPDHFFMPDRKEIRLQL